MRREQKSKEGVSVVIPNLNGGEDLAKCLDSLENQSLKPHIIVVDNASSDNSLEVIAEYKDIELIKNDRNYGFTGGVNPGLRKAIKRGDEYLALFNNDAVADKYWLEKLVRCLDKNPKAAAVTSKIISTSGEYLDSTGDFYTTWGLPYPRGRREVELDKYDSQKTIFAASGGASLYRAAALREIGLFDEDFFAYYEDIDISFRARLAGWEVLYEPEATVHHHISATSSRLPGFATYQTVKNLPWLYVKNMPFQLFWRNLLRFELVYWSIIASAVRRGNGWYALKGWLYSLVLLPKKLLQRWQIQHSRKVSAQQVSELLVHDLPPNAYRLRRWRSVWWRLIRKNK